MLKNLLSALLFTFVLLSSTLPSLAQANDPNKEEWVQLFNGKDLKDWRIKINGYDLNDNFANTFRVKNGLMQVGYEGYGGKFNDRFGHIFYKDKFSYYRIRVEYRFFGDQCPGGADWATRNSGIMLHCQDPKTMGKKQDFPISIEFQLLGGLGKGPRPTANLCTPGTNVEMNGKLFTPHCLNSKSKTFDGDGWVKVEAEVHGSEWIRHLVDGVNVLSYEKPQIGGGNVEGFDPTVKKDGKLLEEGWISLQSESHPVEFRKVELLNLCGCMDPKASNYKKYFVKADNSQCKYKKK